MSCWPKAGAIVTDFVGGHNYENSGNIVVANPRVLKEMLGKIRENLPESLANKPASRSFVPQTRPRPGF